MKDLGNQSLFSGRKKSLPFDLKGRTLTIAGAVAFVVLVGYFVLSGTGSSSDGTSSVGGVTLKDAPTNLKPVALNGAAKVDGVDLKTETARMSDVKYGGQATATVSRAYGGGIYKLDVSANLPDPKNTYYAVFLTGGAKPVLVDYLNGSGTHWSLSISDSSNNYASYRGVLITLKRTKDTLPEEHVMEGSF